MVNVKIDEFFANQNKLGIALTYADVRLRTGYSEVMPDDVNTESKFSRNVSLKIPIVGAAMDTVTEYKMAIALAKRGGIGVIHKNLTPEEQARQVARVKNHLNGIIAKPVYVDTTKTIENIIRMRKEKHYEFQTFPVVDDNKQLVGILTRNDFDLCDDLSQLVENVMTTNPVTANSLTNLDEAYNIMKRAKKKVLPLIDTDGKISGMYIFSDIKRIKFGNGAPYNTDENNQLVVAAAIGVGKSAIERAEKLVAKKVDVLVIDTAHADSKPVYETIKELKKEFPTVDVVAGNITEPDSAKRLTEAGVDGIKVGQGGGSICTTRIIAGIGCPQVTAVYNCAKAIQDTDIPICADGGLQYSGDITIATATGAQNVMMGSMLAGTDASPGELVYSQGRQWKKYRGMGSLGAMETNKESRDRYGQKETGKKELIPEGIEGLTPYKGSIADVLFQYVGGLKRGMGYVGAASIKELQKKADLWRPTSAGQHENHPHDVTITESSPNYQTE